jgi:hypothetical protein
MDEYKQKTEKHKLKLIDIINLKVKDIDDQGNIALSRLNDAFKSSIDAFEARVQKSIQEIGKQTMKSKRKLEDVANNGVQEIENETGKAIKKIQKSAKKRKILLRLFTHTYIIPYHYVLF